MTARRPPEHLKLAGLITCIILLVLFTIPAIADGSNTTAPAKSLKIDEYVNREMKAGNIAGLSLSVKEERQIRLESTIDGLRQRFGHFSIQRAFMLTDKQLTDLNPKDDHVIHPVTYR